MKYSTQLVVILIALLVHTQIRTIVLMYPFVLYQRATTTVFETWNILLYSPRPFPGIAFAIVYPLSTTR
jgi:hypothetical protein